MEFNIPSFPRSSNVPAEEEAEAARQYPYDDKKIAKEKHGADEALVTVEEMRRRSASAAEDADLLRLKTKQLFLFILILLSGTRH